MMPSFSPRRHYSGPTVVTKSRSKSPHKKKFMLRSSPQPCSSPFHSPAVHSPLVKITKSPALQNLTPLRHKSCSTSPIKFPLSLATNSELNTVVTPPPKRKPILRSPLERHAMQRCNRLGIGVENGSSVKSCSSPSPVKRDRGLPVSKRRLNASYTLTDTPPFDISPSPSKTTGSMSPRGATAKRSLQRKSGNQSLLTERPTYAKSRPQARNIDFATPTDPASKIRRSTSVKSLSTMNSLPSASIHPHSNASTRSSLHQTTAADVPSDAMGRDWVTPQSYKLAKPDPAAFHSTGFIPKRGRLSTGSSGHQQPDTPCKKLSYSMQSIPGVQPASSIFVDFPSPTEASRSTGTFSLLKRKEPIVMHNNDISPTQFGSGDLSSSGEFDMPPTPTKTVYGTNLSSLFGAVGGTKRKGESRPQSPYSRGTGRATRARIRASPHSPKPESGGALFPDASYLSIEVGARRQRAPQTPAKERSSASDLTRTIPRTPTNLPLESPSSVQASPYMTWTSRFSEVRLIGSGEFSQVYLAIDTKPRKLFDEDGNTPNKQLASPRVSSPLFSCSPSGSSARQSLQLYAVKKSKSPYSGVKDRDRRLEEVRILMELGSHPHVVKFVSQWEEERYLFIQTEYCENGSLDKFLDIHGSKGRLDEFRVWKILIELSLGIKHIHDCGFMHLDIKPANVLISFGGTLKISDFGMATRWPAPSGIEREGDRQYIAPEVIQTGRYDKQVDIFSLGLTIIETAGNEGLPPNGPVWQSLRNGDLSGAPILSTSVSGEFVIRDEEGNPITTELLDGYPSVTANMSLSSESSLDSDQFTTGLLSPGIPRRRRAFYRTQSGSKKLLHTPRTGDLIYPPKFMEDSGLERVVQLMLAPDPNRRPKALEILNMEEVKWVDSRRRAPATVFEGLWGPDLKQGVSGKGSTELLHPVRASVDTSLDWKMLSDA